MTTAGSAMKLRLPSIVGMGALMLFAGFAFGQTFAIPPGQEETVRDMVGPAADQAWPCTLQRTQAGPDRILAQYDCDGRPVRLVLDHPTRADGAELARTERFVVRLDDAAPPQLAALIEARVRAGEGSFRWRVISDSSTHRQGSATQEPPGFSSPLLTLLRSPTNFAITVLLLAACLFVADRKLRRRRDRRS